MADRGMCTVENPNLKWDSASYGKHTKANKKTWERSFARTWSKERNSASQFNPNIPRGDLECIELCCAYGCMGHTLGNYTNSSIFWYEHNDIIGVSEGEFTRFLLVHCNGNSVHGYPVTEAHLRERQKKAAKNKQAEK